MVVAASLCGCAASDVAVWTADSQSVEIEWFAFFDGGYRFKRDRQELTLEQARLLAAIRPVEVSNECSEDQAGATLTVVDKAGKEHVYVADEVGAGCQDTRPYVDYSAVEALLSTAQCLPAKSYNGAALEDAPHIATNDGCLHGIFNATGELRDWWFAVDVSAPGELQLALDECADRVLKLDLLDETGATTLVSAESASGGCPTLTYEVREPGTLAVHVDLVGGTAAGDFYLSANVEP